MAHEPHRNGKASGAGIGLAPTRKLKTLAAWSEEMGRSSLRKTTQNSNLEWKTLVGATGLLHGEDDAGSRRIA
jgi:hypothetical protein